MEICRTLIGCLDRIEARYTGNVPEGTLRCCTQALQDCIWDFAAAETGGMDPEDVERYIGMCREEG